MLPDTNPDCSIMDLWKSSTIADAIVLITEAVDVLKPQTVNACWKSLWNEVVNDFRGFPSPLLTQKSRISLMLQGKLVGKASLTRSLMIKDDTEECVEEHRETLTNKELKDLLKPSTDDDHDTEDLEEAEPSIWTPEKFAAVFQQVQVLKDMILEYDPLMERSLRHARDNNMPTTTTRFV